MTFDCSVLVSRKPKVRHGLYHLAAHQISGAGLGISGLGFGAWDLGFEAQDFRFGARILGAGFGA